MLNILNISTKIVDLVTNTTSSINDINDIKNLKTILEKIKNVDIDSLSISDSYKFIEELKKDIENISL